MTERNLKDTVTGTRSLVSIVDDDESVRESLPELLRQFGFAAQAFSSAEAFLASEFVNETRCLILDIVMPGMSGPELRRELASRRQDIPTIFITANGDMTLRPRLLADGAVECLFKPFSDAALLDALNAAVYVVQIAAKTVAGIDSYVVAGSHVEKGAIFGMIRIGSQVDVVVPWREQMVVRVRSGDRVRAGETVLVE